MVLLENYTNFVTDKNLWLFNNIQTEELQLLLSYSNLHFLPLTFRLNVCYDGEKEEFMSVNVCGQEERYKRHMMFEFDADRKCMSVIVENEAGDIWIMTKGAETSSKKNCIFFCILMQKPA